MIHFQTLLNTVRQRFGFHAANSVAPPTAFKSPNQVTDHLLRKLRLSVAAAPNDVIYAVFKSEASV